MTRRPSLRAQILLPAIYVGFAVYGWIDFARSNPDGLANLGLFLLTLPVTIVLSIVGSARGQTNMLMPEGHGYVGDHALYYVPAVSITALLWWLIGKVVDRWRAS